MGAGTISHSDLDDLDADDHTQYLNATRHTAVGDSAPHHAAVTLGTAGGLSLVGQALSFTLADHDHSGDAGDGDQLDPEAALTSGSETQSSILRADGSGGVEWNYIPDHTHDGTSGQGSQFNPDNLISTGITDGYVLTADGSGGVAWEAAASGGPIGYMLYEDQKTQNTHGGTFTSGSWQTRTLNTEVYDTNADGSLSSNQITLAAGTYIFRAWAVALNVGNHQTRFYNVTDGSVVAVGTVVSSGSGSNTATLSFVTGKFTIASSKAFRLEHRCSTTVSSVGFGYASNWTTEVYAHVEIVRLS
jgi:hypothetical protein